MEGSLYVLVRKCSHLMTAGSVEQHRNMRPNWTTGARLHVNRLHCCQPGRMTPGDVRESIQSEKLRLQAQVPRRQSVRTTGPEPIGVSLGG